jgi:hypothetical protein
VCHLCGAYENASGAPSKSYGERRRFTAWGCPTPTRLLTSRLIRDEAEDLRRNSMTAIPYSIRAYQSRIEFILPALALRCAMACTRYAARKDETVETPEEKQVANIITACFMFFVSASMSLIGWTRGRRPTRQPRHGTGMGGPRILNNLGEMLPHAVTIRKFPFAGG